MQWELIKLRKQHGLSQEKMAKILDINKESYARKERGESQFKLDEVFIIKSVFGKQIEEIFLPSNFEMLEKNNNEKSK